MKYKAIDGRVFKIKAKALAYVCNKHSRVYGLGQFALVDGNGCR